MASGVHSEASIWTGARLLIAAIAAYRHRPGVGDPRCGARSPPWLTRARGPAAARTGFPALAGQTGETWTADTGTTDLDDFSRQAARGRSPTPRRRTRGPRTRELPTWTTSAVSALAAVRKPQHDGRGQRPRGPAIRGAFALSLPLCLRGHPQRPCKLRASAFQ